MARWRIDIPLENSFGLDYPIIQYADDTLLIMPADPSQIIRLKALLQKFSTGVKVNYNKFALIPINISPERCNELSQGFGCKPEALPSPYPGLAMGTTKTRMEHLIGSWKILIEDYLV